MNKYMKRFWVRWYQATDDYRPLTYPPNSAVLGWWCSGYSSDDVAILCALVQANDSVDVMKAIKSDWPEIRKFNSITKVADNFQPGDRFPLSEWMKDRMC